MSGHFESIPIRLPDDNNGPELFNTIRSKLIEFHGGAVTPWTTQNILDNQSAYQDITGLLVDKDEYTYVQVEYTIIRTDGSAPRRERGFLWLSYDSVNGWVFERQSGNADALNFTDSLAITAGGQVQYKSDSMGGSYAGKISWRIVSAVVAEGV